MVGELEAINPTLIGITATHRTSQESHSDYYSHHTTNPYSNHTQNLTAITPRISQQTHFKTSQESHLGKKPHCTHTSEPNDNHTYTTANHQTHAAITLRTAIIHECRAGLREHFRVMTEVKLDGNYEEQP